MTTTMPMPCVECLSKLYSYRLTNDYSHQKLCKQMLEKEYVLIDGKNNSSPIQANTIISACNISSKTDQELIARLFDLETLFYIFTGLCEGGLNGNIASQKIHNEAEIAWKNYPQIKKSIEKDCCCKLP